MARNAILRLIFAYTVVFKKALLLIFYAEYTKGVYDIHSLLWAYHGWDPRQIFNNQGSLKAGKRCTKCGFCKYSDASFNYTIFRLMYKHYVAFDSPKVI